MRRFMLTFIAAVLMLAINAQAVEMNLIYDEIYHYYNEEDVYIEINGERIETREMPPVILMDRTLVPVREVFEAMGATVSWISETSQTQISYDGMDVLFTTGSRTVYLGRARIEIPETDPAPMIINDKTMAPVRIVANLLGFDVEWDSDTRVVSLTDSMEGIGGSVSDSNSSSSSNSSSDSNSSSNSGSEAPLPSGDVSGSIISDVRLDSVGRTDLVYMTYSEPAQPEIFRYNNPERVVIDFSGSQFADSTVSLSCDGTILTSVRGANHDDMARIVLDVESQPNIEIYKSGNGIVITVAPTSGNYTTKVGDLINGADYQPTDNSEVDEDTDDTSDSTTDSTTDTNTNTGTDNSDAIVDLDTSGTVDTTTSNDFDYNSIVIDPGHGGSDPGAVSSGVKESAINLAIAQKVIAKLEADGYNVIATRTDDDTYPTLQDRVDIASQTVDGKIPAIYVSIHCNSFENTSTNGTQVYYHPNSKYGTILAQNIYNANVSHTTLRAAQLHDGSHLYVIRKTIQPAALVETAFLSNSSDRAYLSSEEGQEALAQGIYEGIVQTIEVMKADKGIE